jgi:hypothetical protein
MWSVGYSQMLTFDSGAHQEVKHPETRPDELKVALEPQERAFKDSESEPLTLITRSSAIQPVLFAQERVVNFSGESQQFLEVLLYSGLLASATFLEFSSAKFFKIL